LYVAFSAPTLLGVKNMLKVQVFPGRIEPHGGLPASVEKSGLLVPVNVALVNVMVLVPALVMVTGTGVA
jgi:hypothetical protein